MRQALRILYLDPHPVPDSTPEAMQILQTVDALTRLGASVELVTPAPADSVDAAGLLGRPLADGLCLHHLRDFRRAWWYPSGSSRLFYRQARRLVAASAADAILVRNLKLAEAILRLQRRPPLFFETHEVFAQSFAESHGLASWRSRCKHRRLLRREGYVYHHARGLIALTSLLLQDIHEAFGVESPGVVAPDGVDLDLARAAGATQQDAKPVILYLGSLHPWKGVDTLVRAAGHIEGASIRIAGGTPERIAELRALAARLGVSERVELVGPVAPAQRFHQIAAASVCVLPLTTASIATRYTSPLKLFEYMAMGKPIVAADVPALREVISHGESALLVPPEDAGRLADAVNSLLKDAELATRLGNRSAQLAAERYSWEARARTVLDHITRQLATPPGTANRNRPEARAAHSDAHP